ncbi:unnamed protein product [Psylliodes chrysocephalus]|uniref:CCHC-type domain-containing protein n=1 Tax=Psylliodes chrysocephalus TaxID=3402493 RepID=A0A9P0GFB9_9CUCU|nr:unnamed protein product [Psylliodes chrysocephala]
MRGNQIATIEADEEIAEKLLNQVKLRLVWLSCPIRNRVEIPRCYKCQHFGHLREECKGEDREGDCLRCGQKGHRAKDCKEDALEYCHNCNIQGHGYNTTKCPEYKKLLDAKRTRRNNRPLKTQQ